MRQVVFFVLVVAAVWFAVLAGVTALAALAARRMIMLVHARARTGARDVADRARTRLGTYRTGAQADACRLRLQLRDAVTDTSRTVTAATAAGWPVGDAPSLVYRLERVAEVLDRQLSLIALDRAPAGEQGARDLDELRDRVATVVAACTDLRGSVRQQAVTAGDDELLRLREDCRIESEALRTRPAGLTP